MINFFFQAEDGIRDRLVTGVQTCALPISVVGQTDDYGYNIVKDGVHVHDFHATLLHLLGIDHERLTFKYQGRYFRLTDVHGHVVQGALA